MIQVTDHTQKNFCSECKNKDCFVYDRVHDHYTCTNCGIVHRSIWGEYNSMSFMNPIVNNVHKSIFSIRSCEESYDRLKKYKELQKTLTEATNRIYNMPVSDDGFKTNEVIQSIKDEHRSEKFSGIIKDYCSQLDISVKTMERANSLLTKFQEKILKLRMHEISAICLIIIAQHSQKLHVDMRKIYKIHKPKVVKKRLKEICRILNISLSTLAKYSIVSLSQQLGLNYKQSVVIVNRYNKLKKLNKTIGDKTLIALCFYSYLGKNLDQICETVLVNKNAIVNYINDKKCKGLVF